MNDHPPTNKAYSAPRLIVYGDLRTITETKRKAGLDTAMPPDNKST